MLIFGAFAAYVIYQHANASNVSTGETDSAD
jgi:hypothetical protein